MKYSHSIHLFLLLTIFPICFIATIDPETTQENSEKIYLTNFIRSQLKSSHYIEKILPNNFDHIAQFLEYGHLKSYDKQPYGISILRTFKILLGSHVPYINALALSALLENSDALFTPYVTSSHNNAYIKTIIDNDFYDNLERTIFDALYFKFSTEHQLFKNDPDIFLQSLSKNILTITQETIEIEQFQHTLHIFLDAVIQKLIWDITDSEHLLCKVNTLGQQLDDMTKKNIIKDLDCLDELYWSLTSRFAYIIDMVAERLPITFYHNTKQEIANNTLSFLELEEQDGYLQTKKEYLLLMLCKAEAKRLAYENGIIIN